MSIHCLNSSFETAREWMRDLMTTLDTGDDAFAYRALKATLHELRDHLTIEEAAHFSAQLPVLFRGVFYDGWRPAGTPSKDRSVGGFLEKIGASLRECQDLVEVENVVHGVLELLNSKISHGEIKDVVGSLPKEIRQLWPSANTARSGAKARLSY